MIPYPDPILNPEKKLLTRRNFLWALIVGVSGVISAIIGIPLAGFLISPAIRKGKEEWTAIADLAGIPLKEPFKVTYTSIKKDAWLQATAKKIVYVVKNSDTEIYVMSTVCTHMGCLVHWDDSKKEFLCPCHGGVYDVDGKVLAGPPPRPLDRMQKKLEKQQLFVMES
jgi:menaquinol-cytochrome c reductase iron-sulfur subunit